MVLTELIQELPGKVCKKRVSKDIVADPSHILFLTQAQNLSNDVLYITDALTAAAVLPGCTTSSGATVLCTGELDSDIHFQVLINLLCVECGLLDLHNSASVHLAGLRRKAEMESEHFRNKFAEIIDGKVNSSYEIERLCGTFPKKIKSSFCVICINSPDTVRKTHQDQVMRYELEELFPEDNVTSYDGSTIVIHSYDGFLYPPPLPMEELSAILKKYNAYAGVSNGIRKTKRLRHQYISAKLALSAGHITGEKETYIFMYDDSMIYNIVALAALGFQSLYNEDDIITLGTPILAKIMKHDPNGKRGLLDTLITYITNGMSSSKTAEIMHIHRNTVLNRIALIEEIIGKPLSNDSLLQAKLILTYYLHQHFSRVWHKELELSPLEPEE